ncbi:unnamed protein product [Protopolystoma xenopodis]|uniref:NADH dehydrogenase [ubiquinone] 1 alpha subcomplex subunit 5 n=1 Tax=Protopolystoma xenopodis TaxID=117903 RepID=A0A448WSF6_9PLAT|nr:unnamed protein product [Protopolystoma xenopodis]
MQTTGLTGLRVHKSPHAALKALYGRTLRIVQTLPNDAAYRRHTEAVLTSRLKAVMMESDVLKLEKLIGGGQVEELITQANREYDLAKMMLRHKVWEPLVEEPHPDQWKWPI